MKIGILTQPLTNNYGGLLQAYALQTVLERMGHQIIILNRPMKYVPDSRTLSLTGRLTNIIKFILRRPQTIIFHELTPEQRKVVNRFTASFISIHHHKSPDFTSTWELKQYCKEHIFDAYIVGSDQCWRPQYSPCLQNYYLDFAQDWNVRRVAYAASFGVDYWEYSNEMTKVCASLAQKFNAISVREDSGISLCKEHLGINAVHVLDPTMLLNPEDYNALIDSYDSAVYDIAPEHSLSTVDRTKGKKLFTYVLDPCAKKKQFVRNVSQETDLSPVYCMPKDFRAQEVFEKCPDDCTYPPVELWLQSFRDSEMVITDSFHGTVFSIIYNKPFWVLGNPSRGMARISSLLKIFRLEDRLISSEAFDNIDISKPINWEIVNSRRKELKNLSLHFLESNLE